MRPLLYSFSFFLMFTAVWVAKAEGFSGMTVGMLLGSLMLFALALRWPKPNGVG
jgi:hypothetical protein